MQRRAINRELWRFSCSLITWEKIRFSLTLNKNWWRIFHVSVGALNALCPSQGFRCLGCARSLVGNPLVQERLWAQAQSLGAGPSWGQPCLCPATDPPTQANIPAWPWPVPIPMAIPSPGGCCRNLPGGWGSCLPPVPPAHVGQHLLRLLSGHYMELPELWKWYWKLTTQRSPSKTVASIWEGFRSSEVSPSMISLFVQKNWEGFQPRRIRRTWPSWPFSCREGKPNISYHSFSLLLCPHLPQWKSETQLRNLWVWCRPSSWI